MDYDKDEKVWFKPKGIAVGADSSQPLDEAAIVGGDVVDLLDDGWPGRPAVQAIELRFSGHDIRHGSLASLLAGDARSQPSATPVVRRGHR